MADTWFDPDAIRGDFEKTLAELFNPAPYASSSTYAKGDLVQYQGNVYSALVDDLDTAPPGEDWQFESRVLPLLYENVNSAPTMQGAIRIQISWFLTQNASVGCPDGSLRSIDGTLSSWIFSPRSQGTSAGLRDASRMRRVLGAWRLASDCGKQVMVYGVNGPRGAPDLLQGADFHTHIITCSLRAMERVGSWR